MMSVASQTMPIEMMNTGDSGIVVDLTGHPNLVARLQEMGLHPGARVRMIRSGTPCIIEVDHHRLSVRFDDSVLILVDVHS